MPTASQKNLEICQKPGASTGVLFITLEKINQKARENGESLSHLGQNGSTVQLMLSGRTH